MISERTLVLFSYLCKVGSWFHCIPFHWNAKTEALEYRRKNLYLGLMIFHTVQATLTLLAFSIRFLQSDLKSPVDIAITLIFFFPSLAIISTEVHLIFYHSTILSFFNSHLLLQKLWRTKTWKQDKDGLEEIILTIFRAICIHLTISFQPFNIGWVIYQKYSIARLISTGYLVGDIFLGGMLWYVTMMANVHALLYALVWIIHINANCLWMSTISDKDIDLVRKRYRPLQILNTWFNSPAFSFFTAISVFWLVLIIITAIVVTFKVFPNPLAIVSAGVGPAMLVFIRYTFQPGNKLTELSTSVIQSGSSSSNHLITEEHKKFLASCPSLYIRPGRLFTLSTETMITCVEQVIGQNVINILLTFR